MNVSVKLSLDKICRICLKEGSNMKGLFKTEDSASPRFHEMMMCCTKVVINENDGLPAQLCKSCANQLTKSFSFKSQCESADICLRQFLEDPLSNSNIDSHKIVDDDHSVLYANNNGESVASDELNFATEKFERNSLTPDVLKASSKSNDNSKPDTPVTSSSDIEIQNIVKSKSDSKIGNKRISSSLVFGCRKCDLHFLSWNELDKHNSNHTEFHPSDKLLCRYCGITFLHERHINPHIRQMHNELERFQCGYCGNRWREIRTLRMHMIKHSPGDASLTTSKNSNTEENKFDAKDQAKQEKSYYKENLDKKENNNLLCLSCRQIFIDVESLQLHLINEHVMDIKETADSSAIQERDVSMDCMENDMQQNQVLGDLKYATKTAEMSQDEDDPNITHFANEIKKLKHACSICGKCFRTMNHLNWHAASHDPDKAYHCQFRRCRWTFASEHELTVHTDVNHSGGEHECRFCLQ